MVEVNTTLRIVMLFQICRTCPCSALSPNDTIYKATTRPKNPTAPRTPAATTFVGAAPAVLELDWAAGFEVFVAVAGVVVALLIMLLEGDPVVGDVVADTVPLPPVIDSASDPSEASSGIMVAATPAIMMTQDCASGGSELYHPGKPLARISLSSTEISEGLARTAVTVAGISVITLREGGKLVSFITFLSAVECMFCMNEDPSRSEHSPDTMKGEQMKRIELYTYSESIEPGGMMSPSREAILERIDERVGLLHKLACDSETWYARLNHILRCCNGLWDCANHGQKASEGKQRSVHAGLASRHRGRCE